MIKVTRVVFSFIDSVTVWQMFMRKAHSFFKKPCRADLFLDLEEGHEVLEALDDVYVLEKGLPGPTRHVLTGVS